MTDRRPPRAGSGPKILPVPPESPAVRSLLPLAATGGKGTHALATVLRNQPLYEAWRPFARYLNGDTSLTRKQRETLILRTAWLARSDYEWGNHVLVARAAGLSDEQIGATCEAKLGEAHEDLLLRVPDELTRFSKITDSTWELLAESYTDEQLVEMLMLVGHYLMAAFLFNSVSIEREVDVPGFEDWDRRNGVSRQPSSS